MKEEFLHYVWKYSLYYSDRLADHEGNKITVIHPGEYNRDAGPDFFNARILAEGTVWAGNVELHVKASQYYHHGHNTDPAYDNVILHVVAENDRKVFNSKGEEILTVALDFDPGVYEKYLSLVNNSYIIACQDDIAKVDKILVQQWLGRLAVERLEDKSSLIDRIFAATGNDWEETFYRVLARYFGFRVNREPFEMLSAALPFRIIRKHSDNLFQLEALLFGVAGMLEEGLFREALHDDYYRKLIKEFKVLSAKYSLKSLHGWIWKFSRLRPLNFPTIRISQLAAMLSVTGGLFSRVTEAGNIVELRKLFDVSSSEYWTDHFIFGKKTKPMMKKAGSQAAAIFLINAVIPVIFVYGKNRGNKALCERALEFLDQIEPEKNVIINEWKSTGIDAKSAFYSQALIHLRDNYCRKRRCLDCLIGSRLIMAEKNLKKNDEMLLEP
ncbi:MAG TPA: DUF2851 family protein [Bacteroidales bacterium]|nr:DUF2851 family protein [Bacteroidales bacterium]